MATTLENIRVLGNSSYEVTIRDGEGAKIFNLVYDERRKSISPEKAFMRYAWRKLLVRDLMIAVGRFAGGEVVVLPMELEESSTNGF